MPDSDSFEFHDQKSLILKIKGVIGHNAWRLVTRPAALLLGALPKPLVYGIGLRLRQASFPYSVIEHGDTVIQVGAPRDLLKVGRSRAAFFSMMVGKTGRVIIFEPEPNSAADMRAFMAARGLSDRVTVVEKGCWSEERVLRFWSNPNHAASNLFEDVSEWNETELRARGYEPSELPVVAIDAALKELGVDSVKLLSITTNGSEEVILEGAKNTITHMTSYLALADTGPSVHRLAERYGFRNIANDDRGFTAKKV